MNRDAFLEILLDALAAIREPRFFETERGYQGELLAMLRARLADAALPGDPIIEQEYQKRLKHHKIRIRPDIIIHVPFERGTAADRRHGNFVAMELKRASADVEEAFESLRQIGEALNYELLIFINIDSDQSHAELCPASIAERTVCIAIRLNEGVPVINMQPCAAR